MKQTIEISRQSIQMTLMAIADDVLPVKAKTFVLKIIEQRLEGILQRYPDKSFRLTVETLNSTHPKDCTCLQIMDQDPKRHFRECAYRVVKEV